MHIVCEVEDFLRMLFLIASYSLCAVLYLGVAGLLWHHSERRLPSSTLILACAVTGLWGVARVAAAAWPLMEVASLTERIQSQGWRECSQAEAVDHFATGTLSDFC